jgi:hypothetical protein
MPPAAWARIFGIKSVYTCKYKSLRIPTLLQSTHSKAERQVLVDSGATDNFISSKLLKRMKIGKLNLPKPQTIWNIDGTHNKSGHITHFVDLLVRCGDRSKEMRFLITDLGEDEIVLGYPWLAAFQPKIDWKNATLDEEMQPLVIKTLGWKIDAEVERIQEAWTRRARTMATPSEAIYVTRYDEERLRRTSASTQLAVKALPKEEKTWDKVVPPQYHHWKKVFSEEEAKRFPRTQPWDIAIDLVADAPKVLDCKIYPLTLEEQGKLREYIKENLEKGYIRPSKSPYSSPFFFVGKKDGKLRPVVDYRKLNTYTVPDRYPLPLIQELVDKVWDARLFTKMNVRAGYNNIRFREGDEPKAAFKTNDGLFEPTVMPFGLRNAPAVFQRMMNTQFADIIATGKVIIYMDDILVATVDDVMVHRGIVHRVLERLQELDLYLKPSKCQFEVRRIEFLGVILENGTVTMDPIKVAGVAEWKEPKNVKDVRKYLGFCNFYRRFIKGFSQIAKPLNTLLKKGVPWTWGKAEQEAFEELRTRVCEEPVLVQPDQKKQFEVEVDASNYAIGAVLMQRDGKKVAHPVAFFSKTMNEAQRNYDVYNRELLALLEMFRHWRQYLHQAAHQVLVHTDHANLLFWKNPGDHNRRVARWHAELMDYDFKLVHISGKKNGRADALSRRPDYDQGESDNKQLVVLPPKFFERAYARIAGSEDANPNNGPEWRRYLAGIDPGDYQPIQDLVEKDQQENPQSQEQLRKWTNTHQLIKLNSIWWKLEDGVDRIVVAGDNNLKRGVISCYHDAPERGHPGISNTYEIMKRDFWWPNMKLDIEQFVKGCAACQANKANTGPLKPAMIPITPEHALPFQTVAMDFITKLPKSGKYDTILTITDHDCSKAAIFLPCQETITAEGVATLYLRYVFPRFGLPKKVISDRDTRFTSKYAKGLCQAMKIRQNISTAYHPRTDGQSERTNQWLEQYLRFWCDERQDDWHKWLPMAEFAHNSWPSATTKQAPYEVIMGYLPQVEWKTKPSPVPNVSARLADLEKIRDNTLRQIVKAQKVMKIGHQGNKRFKPYNEGDLVWVEGTNLKTIYPTAKLGPKRHGPFKVLKQLSEAVYQVEIPRQWKIHNVFHANLITPYKETELHGPNFTRPPPDLVDGEEEYEVEKIIDKKKKGRGRKTYYLVKWKGYSASENSWEPAENLRADELVAEFEKQQPQ